MQPIPVAIRRLTQPDRPLVAQSWAHGLRSVTPWGDVEGNVRRANAYVDRALHRSSAWVLANKADEARILGWACASIGGGPPVLHWIWVREDWRRLGLARRLLAHVLTEASIKFVLSGWSRMGAELVRGCAEMFQPWPECYRPDLGRC